jgi:hypothetical protein
MKKSRLFYIIGTFGNLLLLFKYYLEMNSINCEPCLPDAPCPPCRTDFMENFWTYFIIWNAIGFVYFVLRKRTRTDANKR